MLRLSSGSCMLMPGLRLSIGSCILRLGLIHYIHLRPIQAKAPAVKCSRHFPNSLPQPTATETDETPRVDTGPT